MKRNINFKNVLCMAAITLVTGMLGGCEDNSIATPVGKLPNETALDNNFGMLKCDMTTSDLEITMTNTKTPDFAFFYQTVKPVAQDPRITMKIDLDLVDKYNEEHGTEYRKMSTISIEGISNEGAMFVFIIDSMILEFYIKTYYYLLLHWERDATTTLWVVVVNLAPCHEVLH